MRGVSDGIPAISFLRFSQKLDLTFFLKLSGDQLVSQLLPVFAADDPQDSPVRSWVYRAKAHSRCRETRSLPWAKTSLLPAPLSGFLAFFRSTPSQVKSDQREGQTVQEMLQRRSVWVNAKVPFYLREVWQNSADSVRHRPRFHLRCKCSGFESPPALHAPLRGTSGVRGSLCACPSLTFCSWAHAAPLCLRDQASPESRKSPNSSQRQK